MATRLVARRGFTSTTRRMDAFSPYHYPEGPYTNLPFNPKTRFFWLRYWLFMGREKSASLRKVQELKDEQVPDSSSHSALPSGIHTRHKFYGGVTGGGVEAYLVRLRNGDPAAGFCTEPTINEIDCKQTSSGHAHSLLFRSSSLASSKLAQIESVKAAQSEWPNFIM
ncbi:hypothetical protein PV04_06540 [Phialophora macrospora]|uniref:Uncharacterized protein n=1 Tax=Phialophora macrospora TaxID=1851006 RepID=A0A0D2FKK6_9EURO|nr:hypothetical protein PV04_06540 [Phialophora macrospora]